MVDLTTVSRRELVNALEKAPNAKSVKRLMAALAYLDGVDGTTFASRYDIPPSTVYAWLDRFEQLPVDDAMLDDQRPGRPSKLSDEERAQLEADLGRPPSAFGLDATEWRPSLVREHLATAYGVTYSTAHVRRLLADLDH